MALCSELQDFVDAVDEILEMTMYEEVGPEVVCELQKQIEEKVYDAYPNPQYNRKYYNHGLIDPREIETNYESKTNTLTARSVRDDWEPTMRKHEGRNVAEVVESGDGYDWKHLGPRPFHKPAEDELIRSGRVDNIITDAMERYLGSWQG